MGRLYRLLKTRDWLLRSVHFNEKKGNSQALITCKQQLQEVEQDLADLEPSQVYIPIEALVIDTYGRVIWRDGPTYIIVDSADDLIAGGSDADIRALRLSIIGGKVDPEVHDMNTDQLLRAEQVVASATWVDVGYSRVRSLKQLLGGL